MKNTYPAEKDFGDIFVLTFKIFFKDFWKNIAFGSSLVFIGIVFALPYMSILILTSDPSGYPFFDTSAISIIGLTLTYLLFYAATFVVVPSLLNGYFGPKTIDYLEGKQREKGVHGKVMFRSFGKTCGAQTALMLVYFAFAVVITVVMVDRMSGFNFLTEDAFFDELWSMMGIILVLYLICLVILVLGAFTKQAALFEDKRWFRALGRSIKIIVSGNFWTAVGYYIVFGLVVTTAANFILGFAIFFIFILAILETVTAGVVGAVLIVLIILIGTVVLTAIYAAIYGLFNVFTTLLYFNSRTRCEGTPFPSPAPKEEAMPVQE